MKDLQKLSDQFEALGNNQRMKIFTSIIKEAAYCDIEETPVVAENTSKSLIKITKLAPATVTHHINKLKDAKLVVEIAKGKYKYLFPNEDTLKLMANSLGIKPIEKKTIRFGDLTMEETEFKELVDYLRVNGHRFKKPTVKNNQNRYYSAYKEFILIHSTSTEKVYLVKLTSDLEQLSEIMDHIEKFAEVLARRK